MYKITCFLPTSYSELCTQLEGMHFKNVKGELIWETDGHTFKICPFKNQNEFDQKQGYRIWFNGSMDGGLFLFDMALGVYKPEVKAIEYELPLGDRSKQEWINELVKWNSIETVDTRGFFKKGSVGIVVIPSCVNLLIRPKRNKQLKMVECLKEIEQIREDITPSSFDLFSAMNYNDSEVAI